MYKYDNYDQQMVDTRVEGVRVVATPEAERWGTVTDFATSRGAAAAINGGFWGLWQSPHGITAGGGALWDRSTPDPDFGHFAFCDLFVGERHLERHLAGGR